MDPYTPLKRLNSSLGRFYSDVTLRLTVGWSKFKARRESQLSRAYQQAIDEHFNSFLPAFAGKSIEQLRREHLFTLNRWYESEQALLVSSRNDVLYGLYGLNAKGLRYEDASSDYDGLMNQFDSLTTRISLLRETYDYELAELQ